MVKYNGTEYRSTLIVCGQVDLYLPVFIKSRILLSEMDVCYWLHRSSKLFVLMNILLPTELITDPALL